MSSKSEEEKSRKKKKKDERQQAVGDGTPGGRSKMPRKEYERELEKLQTGWVELQEWVSVPERY